MKCNKKKIFSVYKKVMEWLSANLETEKKCAGDYLMFDAILCPVVLVLCFMYLHFL